MMAVLLLSAVNRVAGTSVTTLGGGPDYYANDGGAYFGSTNSIYGTVYSQFHTPSGIALDSSGNYLFVADRDNNEIRELDLVGGQTYTFTTNLVNRPVGVAVDGAGNVYVLNQGSVNASGLGTNGNVLEFDGFGNLLATNSGTMLLTNAAGIALDTVGDIYVTVNSNTLIRIAGTTITNIATIAIAGTSLQGIVVKHNGLIAAVDSGRNGIYLIDPSKTTGNVTTNAGFNGAGDGTGVNNHGVQDASAKFFQPSGVAEAGDGSLIVADYGNNRIKVVTASGITTNLYGVSSNFWSSSFPGWSDGTVLEPDQTGDVQARLPFGVAFASDGTIYTTEDYYHIIRHVTGTGLQLPPPPPPQVPTPQIGYVDFPSTASPVPYTSVFHAVSSFVFNNDAPIIIEGTAGSQTFYTYGPTPATGSIPDPTSASFSAPVGYQDGLTPGQVNLYAVASIVPDLTIKAIGEKSDGSPNSAIALARFQFVTGNPILTGANAAQFTINDITSGAQFRYTTDGSDPRTNANAITAGPATSTNGISLSVQFPANTNSLLFQIVAFKANYQTSSVVSAVFSTTNFVANSISFGFASGPGSSQFVASPGQTFELPVGLSLLPNAPPIYGLQFNVTLTNLTSDIVDPQTINFGSLLGKPDVNNDGYFQPIQPFEFVSTNQPNNDPNAQPYQGGWYQSLQFANTNNEDLIGVGWLEIYGRTNLYNTLNQNLLTYPIVDGTDPSTTTSQTGSQMVIGAYAFGIPANANPGDVYQIQIGRPSATTFSGLSVNPYGNPVVIEAAANTNLLGSGSVNALKNVTIGQIKYLVGDVYPANWYNAGDFGSGNLVNIDVIRVFDFAAYSIAAPPVASDLFDALDSCGNIGVSNSATGYYTNSYVQGVSGYPYVTNFTYSIVNNTIFEDTNGVAASTNPTLAGPFTSPNLLAYLTTSVLTINEEYTNTYIMTNADLTLTTNVVPVNNFVNVAIQPGVSTLFNGNDTSINQIAFGDGVLDVCDVYVTFRRSLDSSLVWFERFWTNGQRAAITVPNVAANVAIKSAPSPAMQPMTQPASTVPPQVHFAAGDITNCASGQVVQIPITATIFGSYPLRVLMLNLTVEPLDGSPALTTPVQFTQTATVLGTPYTSGSDANGNYSAVWLNSANAGLTGTVTIGTLRITIPAGVSANSAYAVHFDHASASPNGLASFPKQTLTGIITLSSRTNSSYGDGIPDSWRLRWFGTVNNYLSLSNACPTGDGINNWMKYVAGVDPNIGNDFPSTNPVKPSPSGSTASIHWPTVSGVQYVIQRSASLFPGNWSNITTNTGTGTDMEFDDTSAGSAKFYRVLILH